MVFDLHRSLTNKHGEIDEAAAEEFEAGLMKRFADSPEVKPILERTGDMGWAGAVLQYGRIYEGVTVTTMGKRELSRVLLDVFPRKVSYEPSLAPEIVEELRAFWSFVRREFGLPNAEFGVDAKSIRNIDQGKTWRHLPEVAQRLSMPRKRRRRGWRRYGRG